MMTGAEGVVLTDRRAFSYLPEGIVQEAVLADVIAIECREEPILGHTFLLRTQDDIVQLEIAPLNGGDAFAMALEQQTGIEVDCAPGG